MFLNYENNIYHFEVLIPVFGNIIYEYNNIAYDKDISDNKKFEFNVKENKIDKKKIIIR